VDLQDVNKRRIIENHELEEGVEVDRNITALMMVARYVYE
jgi:hypothetical protein